ncbi:putative ATP-dependent RNA helicase TDRD12 isoform X1 [Temnothorax longispinosus]|uniref:putative ATP-dependent RNA helicase TDRD12 isoform X1 n=1 Tax=Temnothorax longispinosus TaxID=300112 RepID=UPI003A997841
MPVLEKSASAYFNHKGNNSQNMNKFRKHQDTAIPPTAKAIRVRNVQNPYIMRACEVEKHKETLYTIQSKLISFMKTDTYLKKKRDEENAKIGDTVFIQLNHQDGINLPSFICRGLITCIKKDGTYCILLVDHGTSIELTRDKLHIFPQDVVSDAYLTKTVGVFGVLPICMKKNGVVSNDSNATAVVVEKWTEEAIQFTKHLLSTSEIVHFDHLVTDESNGREYGEFYCTIDKTVILLSEALFINYHALYIEGDLLKLVETSTQLKEKWYILHVKFSRDRERRNNATCINGLNKSHTKFFLSEKILVQSSIDCDALSDITDLRYPNGIHEGWFESINSTRPRKLQSYIWPAINNGLNVVAIGSSQCGKTSGCVMAVCGQIAIRKKETRSATRPLALILCASSFEVISVQSLCQSFLRSFNNIRSVAAFNGKSDKSVAAMIYSGCQILVTTPRYLARFLNEYKNLLSFDRLSYLVLDNADIILDKYYNSVGELFKKHKIIENREPRGDDRPILQIIISATNWTVQIKKFVHLAMYNPYICIASFIEAVVFKSICPKLYILKSTYKNEKILDLLKDDYTTLRTAIVCVNAKEAEELNNFLTFTKKTLLIHEKMKAFDIQALRESWISCVCGYYPVLICTDPVLSGLSFTNIQWLIHYSVLLKLRNEFNYRFSLLLDNMTQDATNCKISIIIDENNDVQFRSIIRILQRMKTVISPEMLDYVQRIAITLEKDKKDYALCDNVKSFGFCQDQNTCVFRHCILPEIDAPITNIQINDKVKLMVLYVHDTTHFSARIIEHIPHSDESKKITYSNVEYMQTTAKIQNYYGNIENRKMCTSTNVGDICVLEETIDTFKRVQIRRVRYDRNYSDEKFVDVRCIDSGIIHEYIDVRKLMHIPEELLNLPTHVVEIFLADVVPWDEEYMWNQYTNEQVHKWFAENFDGRSYIIGKICLHLGNTIWLDDLKIGTKLIGHPDLIGSSLKKELLLGNFAVWNNNHLSSLLKLCRNCGLTEINGHDISAAHK